MKKKSPEIRSALRHNMMYIPEVVYEASGILVNGKQIKSLVFSTDVAIIRNINAHAVMAVYPFTPQPIITQAIMTASEIPVFCGVGGGTTTGARSVNLAMHAEFQGAIGVVLNAPTKNQVLKDIKEAIDIPIVITIGNEQTDINSRINSGADIINVSGGPRTIDIVKNIRKNFPSLPIIATGGPNEQTIEATIEAGANAITYTPPSISDLFSDVMLKYR